MYCMCSDSQPNRTPPSNFLQGGNRLDGCKSKQAPNVPHVIPARESQQNTCDAKQTSNFRTIGA